MRHEGLPTVIIVIDLYYSLKITDAHTLLLDFVSLFESACFL